MRPPEARLKPKVSAFINAKFDKIEALKPDLVLAFSDLQADLCAELVRRGMNVVVFNQRSVDEILQMIAMLGGLIGCQTAAERLAGSSEGGPRSHRGRRRGVSETPAGVFRGMGRTADLRHPLGRGARRPSPAARRSFQSWRTPAWRRIASSIRQEVARRDPQVIFASWCGKKVKKAAIRSRPGWDATSAVRDDRIFEIKSTYILQPGPASLTDGVQQMHDILKTLAAQENQSGERGKLDPCAS